MTPITDKVSLLLRHREDTPPKSPTHSNLLNTFERFGLTGTDIPFFQPHLSELSAKDFVVGS